MRYFTTLVAACFATAAANPHRTLHRSLQAVGSPASVRLIDSSSSRLRFELKAFGDLFLLDLHRTKIKPFTVEVDGNGAKLIHDTDEHMDGAMYGGTVQGVPGGGLIRYGQGIPKQSERGCVGARGITHANTCAMFSASRTTHAYLC